MFRRSSMRIIALLSCEATALFCLCADAQADMKKKCELVAASKTVGILARSSESEKYSNIGSGVIISTEGDILTSYADIQRFLVLDKDQSIVTPTINIFKISASDDDKYDLRYEAGDLRDGFALLRLVDPCRAYGACDGVPVAPICYNPNVTVGSTVIADEGMEIEAYGINDKTKFDYALGSIHKANSERNRWEADLQTGEMKASMRGWAVYNKDCNVIGFIDEAVDTRKFLITPLRWARTVIENKTSARQACFNFCRAPQHGVNSYSFSADWHWVSDELVATSSKRDVCNEFEQQFNRKHDPDIHLTIDGEKTKRHTPPTAGPTSDDITFECWGRLSSSPQYNLKRSKFCGYEE